MDVNIDVALTTFKCQERFLKEQGGMELFGQVHFHGYTFNNDDHCDPSKYPLSTQPTALPAFGWKSGSWSSTLNSQFIFRMPYFLTPNQTGFVRNLQSLSAAERSSWNLWSFSYHVGGTVVNTHIRKVIGWIRSPSSSRVQVRLFHSACERFHTHCGTSCDPL